MPTSGVVLFGIALVFTFNALVSIMQFVADEDTLQARVLTMGAGSRIMEKLAVLAAAMAIVLPVAASCCSLPRYASAKSGR